MIKTAANKSLTEERRCSHRAATPCLASGGDSSHRGGYSALLWLNLVCLDAPLVAVSWHWLFARSFTVAIADGTTTALFLTAWWIYLADRFADAMSLDHRTAMSWRQRFCLRHRKPWAGAITLIAVADVVIISTTLDRVAVSVGAIVGALALVYLLINRWRPSVWRRLPLKEVSIGVIFAAGTLVGLVRSLPGAALPAWLLFACLCALNCISIAVWERDLDAGQGRISIATEFPHVGRLVLPALALVLVTGCGLAFMSSPVLHLAVAGGAVGLALVHGCRARLQTDVCTALADLVLLTPLFSLLMPG